jgi:hypothetical protein
VVSEGKRFEVTQDSITRTREKYMQGTHQVKAFLDACLEFHPAAANEDEPEHLIKTAQYEVHDVYLNYCRHYNLTPCGEDKLSRELKAEFRKLGIELKSKRIGKKNRTTFWLGLKIKAFKPVEDDDQGTLV